VCDERLSHTGPKRPDCAGEVGVVRKNLRVGWVESAMKGSFLLCGGPLRTLPPLALCTTKFFTTDGLVVSRNTDRNTQITAQNSEGK
jgi:hypothetical protein